MSHSKKPNNQPCHKAYVAENRLAKNKMRRIRKSFGKNREAGEAAALEWKSRYG